MSASEGNDDSDKVVFDLYIKASGIDKETKGSCPICQQFFMITYILGQSDENIDFKVFTVQADCPPKNFAAGWSKKYPVIMVNRGKSKTGVDLSNTMCDTFEEIEQFFESINRENPELKRKNAPNIKAMQVVENIYKHFNHYISGQADKFLLLELKKLNEYLRDQDTKFLVDNVLSFADCHLLPRLQHIRVAGKAYRDFDIPNEYVYVWRYLKYAYEQDAFKSTVPSDQDIVFHYEKKAKNPPRKGSRSAKPTLQKFTYTLDVPEGVLNGVDNVDGASEEQVQEHSHEVEKYSQPEAEVVHEHNSHQESLPEPEPDFAAANSDFAAADSDFAAADSDFADGDPELAAAGDTDLAAGETDLVTADSELSAGDADVAEVTEIYYNHHVEENSAEDSEKAAQLF